MKHNIVQINTDSGAVVTAQAPMIISASRATDIPAFYVEWFFERLEKGYVKWKNPFNGADSYVSFKDTKFIVFWSKNPAPLLPYLDILKSKGIGCYIQYTLNDYEQEGLEPNVPGLSFRIETFKRLVERLGNGNVIWRFDPLILTENIGIDELLMKITKVGDALKGFTEKLVFSFADIMIYKKVSRNLDAFGIKYKEWDEWSIRECSNRLSVLNSERWGYKLATCSENVNLEDFGIVHNSCVDSELIAKISSNDIKLQEYLRYVKRDLGQRKTCGCIISKDIGSSNTCPHLCRYCYANSSANIVLKNYSKHRTNPLIETII